MTMMMMRMMMRIERGGGALPVTFLSNPQSNITRVILVADPLGRGASVAARDSRCDRPDCSSRFAILDVNNRKRPLRWARRNGRLGSISRAFQHRPEIAEQVESAGSRGASCLSFRLDLAICRL
jgi:hypothetical protein